VSYIDDIVKSVGDELATLKRVNSAKVNRWGDATEEDVETKKIKAVYDVVSGEVEEVEEGDFEQGDLRAYIPEYFAGLENGNILEYQDTEYEIDEVIEKRIGHESHYEVQARQT